MYRIVLDPYLNTYTDSLVEGTTYSRLFGLRYLPAASISNVKQTIHSMHSNTCTFVFLPFIISILFLPLWNVLLKWCTAPYTKHTYVCKFIYEPRRRKTCILKCENKKALIRCDLTCWSIQFLKFNILFQDPNTPRLKRDISNNN